VFQKVVHQTHIDNLVKCQWTLSGKFAVKLSLKIPTHLKRVATLHCETQMM